MRMALLEVARGLWRDKRGRHRERETWWWNEEVQENIRGKKEVFKRW